MKTINTTLMTVAFAAMTAVAAPAFAADAPAAAAPQTFAIVDMTHVMADTDVAKDFSNQWKAKQKEYQDKLNKDEDALNKSKNDLVSQKEKLSKEEFEKKAEALQKRVVDWKLETQKNSRILDVALGQATEMLRHEAFAVVSDIAKERNYSAVFTEQAVMLSSPQMDITKNVVDELNKRLKKQPIKWDEVAKMASTPPKK